MQIIQPSKWMGASARAGGPYRTVDRKSINIFKLLSGQSPYRKFTRLASSVVGEKYLHKRCKCRVSQRLRLGKITFSTISHEKEQRIRIQHGHQSWNSGKREPQTIEPYWLICLIILIDPIIAIWRVNLRIKKIKFCYSWPAIDCRFES